MSVQLLRTLGGPLDSTVRQGFVRATEAMWRDLDYLGQKDGATSVHAAVGMGWSMPRLRALAVLNAFYRIVLSPMGVASMTQTAVGLGQSVRIDHGSIQLDAASGLPLRQAVSAFFAAADRMGIRPRWLSAASAGDLAYFVSRTDDETSHE